jgi:hypothetical protein
VSLPASQGAKRIPSSMPPSASMRASIAESRRRVAP